MATALDLRPSAVPAVCYDILETHFGSWFTMEHLVLEATRSRPGASDSAIRRAVYRLIKLGLIETRSVPTNHGAPQSQYRVTRRAYLDREEVEGGL